MKIKFDKESGAFYVTIREGEYSETLDLVEPGFGAYVDIDPEGNVLGLEFLSFEEFAEITDGSAGGLDIPDRIEDVEAFIEERKYRVSAEAERAARREIVRAALNALPSRERKVVKLYFFQGLTIPEIAEWCQTSQNTARLSLSRGIEALRASLRPESGNEVDEESLKEVLSLIA